ncbi:hypothetical protein IAT40_006705 [Kwoniella sp. CBS 6097]
MTNSKSECVGIISNAFHKSALSNDLDLTRKEVESLYQDIHFGELSKPSSSKELFMGLALFSQPPSKTSIPNVLRECCDAAERLTARRDRLAIVTKSERRRYAEQVLAIEEEENIERRKCAEKFADENEGHLG